MATNHVLTIAIVLALVSVHVSSEDMHGDKRNKTGIQPADLVNIGGDNYYISSDVLGLKRQHSAMMICNDVNMRLLSLQTIEKNNLIRNYLIENDMGSRSVFTSRKKIEGNYLWTGIGEMFEYTDWSDGEPSETNDETCVLLFPDEGWSAANSEFFAYFICEEIKEC